MSESRYEVPHANLTWKTLGTIIAISALWLSYCNYNATQTKSNYEILITSFEKQIKNLEKDGKIDPRSSAEMKNLFDKFIDAGKTTENGDALPWLIVLGLSVVIGILFTNHLKL